MTLSPMTPLGPVWAMLPASFQELRAGVARAMESLPDMQARLATASGATLPMHVVENVAVIDLRGPLTKHPSWLSWLFGGCSCVEIEAAFRAALTDSRVDRILLRVDSPGGSLAGVAALADTVAAANKSKRVMGFIEDVGASAAYFVASQAGELVAGRASIVGSIGVYSVVEDWSAFYEKAGIRTITVRSGALKGIGIEGEAVSEEHVEELRRSVVAFHELFIRAVASGRNLPPDQVRPLATGGVWIGQESVRNRLADRVGSFDALLASMVRRPTPPDSRLTRAEGVVADVRQCIESHVKTEKMTGHFDATWTRRRAFHAAMERHGPAIRDAFAALAATGDVRAVAPDLADLHAKLLEREAELSQQARDAAEAKAQHERWKRSTIF